jgi:HSP20 family protein
VSSGAQAIVLIGGDVMNIVRWKPMSNSLDLFRGMNRLLDNTLIHPNLIPLVFNGHLNPAVDIHETDGEHVVKAEMPGVEAEGLNIDINDGSLTIKGETSSEKEIKQENYYSQECRYGTLARSIPLPTGLNIDKAKAELENGILTVTIPKSPNTKPKTVKVKAKQKTENKKEKQS